MKPSEQNAIDVADAHIKKHAIAYYRSSSERQSEHSISVQQAHIRAWAVKNGIKIIREFSDAGKSGSIDEERPAFVPRRRSLHPAQRSLQKAQQAIDLHRRW